MITACVKADDDADKLIADTALQCALNSKTMVHAEDTDILIILLSSPECPHDLVFAPLKKASKKAKKFWPIQKVQKSLGLELCLRLLFIHAFSGCDTTSRPFGMGKSTVLTKVLKDSDLCHCADIFVHNHSSTEDVIRSGDLAMRLLTGGKQSECLAKHRYKEYKKRVLKGNKMVTPEYLPPTSGSTREHSLRVRHQVMTWLGVKLPPELFGWEFVDNTLRPVITKDPPAPQELLKSIYCNCKSQCETKKCSCRSFNLKCTDICGNCLGERCSNV